MATAKESAARFNNTNSTPCHRRGSNHTNSTRLGPGKPCAFRWPGLCAFALQGGKPRTRRFFNVQKGPLWYKKENQKDWVSLLVPWGCVCTIVNIVPCKHEGVGVSDSSHLFWPRNMGVSLFSGNPLFGWLSREAKRKTLGGEGPIPKKGTSHKFPRVSGPPTGFSAARGPPAASPRPRERNSSRRSGPPQWWRVGSAQNYAALQVFNLSKSLLKFTSILEHNWRFLVISVSQKVCHGHMS